MSDEIVIEFFGPDGRAAARVTLPERTMFWSDGRFEPGEAFDDHREVFDHVEQASKRFQSTDSGDAELLALELAWRKLNAWFTIRERGESSPVTDFGLHLDGDLASVRY